MRWTTVGRVVVDFRCCDGRDDLCSIGSEQTTGDVDAELLQTFCNQAVRKNHEGDTKHTKPIELLKSLSSHTPAQHGQHVQTRWRLLARLPRTAPRLSHNASTAKPKAMQTLALDDEDNGIQ